MRLLPRRLLLVLATTVCMGCRAAAWRNVVFVTNWAKDMPPSCQRTPRNIPAKLATVMTYAFLFLSPDLQPKMVDPRDAELIGQLNGLKRSNPKLKTQVAIGGWSMNVLNSTYALRFSEACATRQNRTKFIRSAMAFCRQWGFDGLDIDWEYPAVVERGGRPADYKNFPLLLKQFRKAIQDSGKPFLLSISAGTTPDGYSGLNLPKIHPYLDWINLMAYDYHGSEWENFTGYNTPWVAAKVTPADDIGISDSLAHFISAGVPPAKLNLGLALFGRSWNLVNATKSMPGDKATAGREGHCTEEAGYIGWREIKPLLAQYNTTLYVNNTLKAAYLVTGDFWVSFDTADTIQWKMQAAKKLGLGGTMVWEADLDDENFSMLKLIKKGPAQERPCGSVPGGFGVVGTGICVNTQDCCNHQGYCYGYEFCSPASCVGGPCLPRDS